MGVFFSNGNVSGMGVSAALDSTMISSVKPNLLKAVAELVPTEQAEKLVNNMKTPNSLGDSFARYSATGKDKNNSIDWAR